MHARLTRARAALFFPSAPLAFGALGALAPLQAQAGDGAPPLSWVGGGQYDISGLDVTPDGALLVTCSATDETIKVWSMADGAFVRTLAAHLGAVEDVALSPDGSKLISGGETAFGSGVASVMVWDVAQGDVLLQIPNPGNLVFCVDWSPGGTLVAYGDQANNIRLHSAADGHLVKTLTAGGFGGCFDLAFSPDGAHIAAAYADNLVRVWNVATGLVEHTLTGHTFFVDSVAWSPDGARLASGSWDDTIRTWNAATGALEHVLLGHTNIVRDLDFSPDGALLASGSWDASVRLWDAASGAPGPVFTSPSPGAVNALRYTADGARLALGGIGAGGFVLSMTGAGVLATVGHHRGNVISLALSAGQTRLASGSSDTDVRVWDAESGEDLLTYEEHEDVVNDLDLSADGALAATGAGSGLGTPDHTLRLWDTATGQTFHVLFGHTEGTTAVDLTDDSTQVVSGGFDGQIKTWSTASGALLKTFPSSVGTVTALALAPGGARLAVCGSALRILDAASGAVQLTLAVPGGSAISSLSWSSDGAHLLAGASAYGDNLHLYDAQTGALVRTFSGDPDGFVQGVALSPDGRFAACGSGYSRSVRTFAVADGTPLKRWDEEAGWGPFPSLPMVYAADARLAYGRADATVVMSACPGAIEAYGAGCAGAGGFVPVLAITGCATPGGALELTIAQGAGGGLAVLALGHGQADIPLLGCTLLVAPPLTTPVVLPLAGVGPGAGTAQLSAPLSPATPPLVVALQAGILDPGAPSGLSATNGVLVTVE